MEEIVGFTPTLPALMTECYGGQKHLWVVIYETGDYQIAKCEHCLMDAVIYRDLETVAEKLFGYKYGSNYEQEEDR